jgi:hypothetical protein
MAVARPLRRPLKRPLAQARAEAGERDLSVLWIVLACFALAFASLVLPSEPSYDPWAWLVWGREIPFLDLDTHGGPSWKPLPVVFTVLYAPFSKIDSGIPAALWIVTARAGGLLALVWAFRVAARLAGPGRWVGYGAGAVALLALLLTPQWVRYMAHGNEPPMAVFFLLFGVERHLDGKHGHAVVLGFLACLLRPEVFPFMAIYAIYLWRSHPDRRRLVLLLFAALPVLWLVPEWIGSGDPLGGGAQARSEPSWSLSLQDQPWLAALRRGHHLAGMPLEFGALAALVFAAYRRERVTLVLGGVAIGWLGLMMVMTESGFSGNSRYFLPALVIVSLLAGVGAGRLVAAARRVPLMAVAAIAIAAASYPYVSDRWDLVERQGRAIDRLTILQADLHRVVERVPGQPEAAYADGYPTINRAFHTRLAWELKAPIRWVELGHGQAMIFRSTARGSGAPAEVRRYSGKLVPVTSYADWRVERRTR